MKPEETIDFNLRWTWLDINRYYNDTANEYGSSMSVGMVLLNIDLENGTPSTKLGPKMGMESTSLSRILKNMEEKDLIYRKPNPNDGRGVLVCLTEFGLEKREDAKAAVFQFNNTIFNSVNKKDLDAFFRVANSINTLINNKEIFQKDEANH